MTALAEFLPAEVGRVLDLGTGDGVTSRSCASSGPARPGVAADFSAEMLGRARARFAGDDDVEVVAHDLDAPLPDGVGRRSTSSSAASRSTTSPTRASGRSTARSTTGCGPGGTFLNLEHVASPTPELHDDVPRRARHRRRPTTTRRTSSRRSRTSSAGCGAWDSTQVDCHWKWRELALARRGSPVTRPDRRSRALGSGASSGAACAQGGR